MNLRVLYKLQKELEHTILNNIKKRTGKEMDKDTLLGNTILALQVEVSEFANATRCFKHWSIKGPDHRETLLDEFADIIHCFFSIGNQTEIQLTNNDIKALECRKTDYNLSKILIKLNGEISSFEEAIETMKLKGNRDKLFAFTKYENIFTRLIQVMECMNFTYDEVEEAYLKKNKINYERQENNY